MINKKIKSPKIILKTLKIGLKPIYIKKVSNSYPPFKTHFEIKTASSKKMGGYLFVCYPHTIVCTRHTIGLQNLLDYLLIIKNYIFQMNKLGISNSPLV